MTGDIEMEGAGDAKRCREEARAVDTARDDPGAATYVTVETSSVSTPESEAYSVEVGVEREVTGRSLREGWVQREVGDRCSHVASRENLAAIVTAVRIEIEPGTPIEIEAKTSGNSVGDEHARHGEESTASIGRLVVGRDTTAGSHDGQIRCNALVAIESGPASWAAEDRRGISCRIDDSVPYCTSVRVYSTECKVVREGRRRGSGNGCDGKTARHAPYSGHSACNPCVKAKKPPKNPHPVLPPHNP